MSLEDEYRPIKVDPMGPPDLAYPMDSVTPPAKFDDDFLADPAFGKAADPAEFSDPLTEIRGLASSLEPALHEIQPLTDIHNANTLHPTPLSGSLQENSFHTGALPANGASAAQTDSLSANALQANMNATSLHANSLQANTLHANALPTAVPGTPYSDIPDGLARAHDSPKLPGDRAVQFVPPFVIDLDMVRRTMDGVNRALGVDLGGTEVSEQALLFKPDSAESAEQLRESAAAAPKAEVSHVRLICDACGYIVTSVAYAVLEVAHESFLQNRMRNLPQLPPKAPVRKKRGGVLGFRELANRSNLSPWHFHRVFRFVTGVTPKAYGEALWEYLMLESGFDLANEELSINKPRAAQSSPANAQGSPASSNSPPSPSTRGKSSSPEEERARSSYSKALPAGPAGPPLTGSIAPGRISKTGSSRSRGARSHSRSRSQPQNQPFVEAKQPVRRGRSYSRLGQRPQGFREETPTTPLTATDMQAFSPQSLTPTMAAQMPTPMGANGGALPNGALPNGAMPNGVNMVHIGQNMAGMNMGMPNMPNMPNMAHMTPSMTPNITPNMAHMMPDDFQYNFDVPDVNNLTLYPHQVPMPPPGTINQAGIGADGMSDGNASDPSQNDMSQNDLGQNDLGQNDLGQNDLSQNDLSQNDLSQNDLSQNDMGAGVMPGALGADLSQDFSGELGADLSQDLGADLETGSQMASRLGASLPTEFHFGADDPFDFSALRAGADYTDMYRVGPHENLARARGHHRTKSDLSAQLALPHPSLAKHHRTQTSLEPLGFNIHSYQAPPQMAFAHAPAHSEKSSAGEKSNFENWYSSVDGAPEKPDDQLNDLPQSFYAGFDEQDLESALVGDDDPPLMPSWNDELTNAYT